MMSGPWSNIPPSKKALPALRLPVLPREEVKATWGRPGWQAATHGLLILAAGTAFIIAGSPVAALFAVGGCTAYFAALAVFETAPHIFKNPRPARKAALALACGSVAAFGAAMLNANPYQRDTPTPDVAPTFDRQQARLQSAANEAFGCVTQMTVERAPDQTPLAVTFRCPAPPPNA